MSGLVPDGEWRGVKDAIAGLDLADARRRLLLAAEREQAAAGKLDELRSLVAALEHSARAMDEKLEEAHARVANLRAALKAMAQELP